MSLFSRFKAQLGDIRAQAEQLRSDIEALEEERRRVAEAGPARSDLEANFDRKVDAAPGLYAKHFIQTHFHLLTRGGVDLATAPAHDTDYRVRITYPRIGLSHPGELDPGAAATQLFLLAAFPNEARRTFRAALDKYDFSGAGLPLEQRRKELAKIDAEIKSKKEALEEFRGLIADLTPRPTEER